MIIKYDARISNRAIDEVLKYTINQVYRLLPVREEDGDWEKVLKSLIVEIAGMDKLLSGQHKYLFLLLCKLEGMKTLQEEEDFTIYRKTVFECLSLLGDIRHAVQS